MSQKFEFTLLKADSAESIFFTRELTKVQAQTYDVKFPQLKARTFVPTGDAGLSPGDEVGIYQTYTHFGVAQWISDYATDFPRADVSGTETTYRVYSLGSSYDYSVQEVRAAAAAGKPLEQKRANAARWAIEKFIDTVLAVGDSTRGLYGLTNQPSALDYAVPNNAGATSTLWTAKTPDEILKDMYGMISKITQTTLGVEEPNRLLLAQARYELIRDTRVGDFDSTTILQMFLRNAPAGFRVDPWYKLDTAASGGGPLAICYRDSPDALLGVIPQEFEQFPPQTVGMVSKTHCHARTGGVISYYPLSICYADLY